MKTERFEREQFGIRPDWVEVEFRGDILKTILEKNDSVAYFQKSKDPKVGELVRLPSSVRQIVKVMDCQTHYRVELGNPKNR